MIALTAAEWGDKKDKLAKSENPGFKVVVYDHRIAYNRKNSPTVVLGKFELTEERGWRRL